MEKTKSSSYTFNCRRIALIGVLALSQFVYSPSALAEMVWFAGRQAFDIPAAAGGLSPAQRADSVQKNLDNALLSTSGQGRAAPVVSVSYVKGAPILTLGGYYIATVDSASARKLRTTSANLAKTWANSLRNILQDRASVENYIAQLTGGEVSSSLPPTATMSPGSTTPFTQRPVFQSRVVYMPAGTTFPVTLMNSISSEIARPGDLIQARLDQSLYVDGSTIPSGSMLTGRIADSEPGHRLLGGGPARLELVFDTLRLPDGNSTPITARIIGGLEAEQKGMLGKVRGSRIGRTALHGGIGAGLGAALGTAVGAIAGGGRGVGRGAWSGAAIGGGLGALHGLFLTKGANITIPSGRSLTVQLDTPASVAVSGPGMM